MSLMVIFIHIRYDFAISYPIVRIVRVAVPTFFVLSSYFFFKKIDNTTPEQQFPIYKNYIVRSCKLYLFWFVIQLPITAYNYGFIGSSPLELKRFFINIFLGSTWFPSWYISALIIGITFVYFLRNRMWIVIILAVIFYTFNCLTSYFSAIGNDYITETFQPLFDVFNPNLSFLAGLAYLIVGRYLSKLKPISCFSASMICLICISIFFAELIFIWNPLLKKGLGSNYFSLLLLAPSLVIFAKSIPQFNLFNTINLRHLSTTNYCFHYVVIFMLQHYFAWIVSPYTQYFVTLTITTIVGLIIIYLAKTKPFNWLKYAY